MLAMTISLLFALAAVTALAVAHRSLIAGNARARLILAELAELERCVPANRPVDGRFRRVLAAA